MTNETTDRYSKIVKDCFWAYHFSTEEIEQFLFEKFLLNSTELFNAMKCFDKDDLKSMLEHYVVPPFNRDYIYRRKNSLEYYYLDKLLMIDELKWIA